MCHMISRCVTSVRRGVTRRACVVWGSVAAPTRSRPSTSFEPVGEPGLRRRQAEGAQAAKVVCRRQFRTQVCVLEGHPLPLPSARPCPQATYTIASVRSLPSLRLVLPGLASSSHSLSPSPATPGHLPFSWLSDLNLSVSLGLDSTPNMFEDERGEARRLSLPCARHIPDQCHCRSWRETLTRSPTLLIARPCHCLTSQAPLGVTPL